MVTIMPRVVTMTVKQFKQIAVYQNIADAPLNEPFLDSEYAKQQQLVLINGEMMYYLVKRQTQSGLKGRIQNNTSKMEKHDAVPYSLEKLITKVFEK